MKITALSTKSKRSDVALIPISDPQDACIETLAGELKKFVADHLGAAVEAGCPIALPAPPACPVKWVVLFSIKQSAARQASAKALCQALALKAKTARLYGQHLPPETLQAVLKGVMQAGIRYPGQKADDERGLESLHVDNAKEAAGILKRTDAVASGMELCRKLVLQPANILTPRAFADECGALSSLGLRVTVLDEHKINKLGMGGLLGIAQGSAEPPRVVQLEWRPQDVDDPPLALIGKGVTFDSGGISLKQKAGMERMKYDMAGAAAVVGVIKAAALQNLQTPVCAVIGLVENMPSGAAIKPGDVVTCMSGTTVEVENTDAEGRMVLADLLCFANSAFEPKAMINIATLTGAVTTALGADIAGLYANDDALAATLQDAAAKTGEALWRMPLPEHYADHMKGSVSDLRNMGRGREAGSIYAAIFLQHFVGNTPWAHLDIANTAWSEHDPYAAPQGATGYSVDLLERVLRA
ncbi:MAG: leucyl aminopeptidase [Pseudomonadota bacterium]